jgi:hypothetical protein
VKYLDRARLWSHRVGLPSAFGTEPSRLLPAGWGRLLAIGMVVVGFVYALLRTSTHSAGVLWAEDGAIFVAGAPTVSEGLAHIPKTYAGYLHLVPRIIAAVAAAFPDGSVAYVYTVAAALVTSLLALFVFAAARRHFASPVIPFLVWFQFLALTLAFGEVANTVANLHWYLDAALFWAVFTRFDSKSMRLVAGVVTVSAILSDPSAMLAIIPLAARLLIFGKSERPYFVTVLIVTVMQAAAFVIAPSTGDVRPTSEVHPSVLDFIQYYAVRVVLAPVLGVRVTEGIPGGILTLVSVAGLVVFVAVFAWMVIRAPRARGFVIAAVGYSILIFVVSWYNVDIFVRPVETGARYVIVPVFCASVLAFAFADDLITRFNRRRVLSGIALAATIAVVLFAPVVDGRIWDDRANSPLTADEYLEAENECAAQPVPEEVRLDIAPDTFSFGVTCDQLLDD